VFLTASVNLRAAVEFYVSPAGNDANPGTKQAPFANIAKARDVVRARAAKTEPVNIYLGGGTYYLPDTLVFEAADSGTKDAPITYAAVPGEEPILSGGTKLQLEWTAYRDGIMQAKVPADLTADQLFVNGQRQQMARYPNFDPNVTYFNGFAADAISPERVARWADPAGGFIKAMHRSEWGDYTYLITGKDEAGNLKYEGGWQNNRQMGMHPRYRMVENIFEELDAPNEWFLNTKTHTLYFYPPADVDLKTATIEVVRLRHLVEFRGTQQQPVKFITLKGLTFRHAARTFMDNKEPLLRSDWTTYRGGAIFFNGAEDCTLEDGLIDQVGGNAVFVNKYNRRITIRTTQIAKAGGNGVAFVGDPDAVRSPLFEYNQVQPLEKIDRTPGPKTDNYPADCLVDNCLIYNTGRFEKQTAPVQISMSMSITVRHCSIYDVPRAGINISEGTWGGHIIEFCDIFDTVKETGDHGSFNSWGRDRFWRPNIQEVDAVVKQAPELPFLDVVKPIILRNNRWRCDHGWDIDLDDGSSRYEIYNNLCLNSGIKNREGYGRLVENNILVNNSFHPHVWYASSGDIFRRNIVFNRYQPIRVAKPWGKEIDWNLLHTPGQLQPTPATVLQGQSGRDENSVVADAMFINPAGGDYRVRDGSPALQLGFKNFPMDQFGVTDPKLRAIARTPVLPQVKAAATPTTGPAGRDERVRDWLGAKIKNVTTLGERSAAGLPGEAGVMLVQVPAQSQADKSGLKAGDVILTAAGRETNTVEELVAGLNAAPTQKIQLEVWRNQQRLTIELSVPSR
jgi:hypothetical protein